VSVRVGDWGRSLELEADVVSVGTRVGGGT